MEATTDHPVDHRPRWDQGPSAAFQVLDRLSAQRSSCRAFDRAPLPRELIADLLEVAGRTASWCNSQPWHVVVTDPDETDALRARLLGALDRGEGTGYDVAPPAAYDGVFRDRRRAAGFALYDSVGIARDDQAARMEQGLRNFRFFDAPHVVVVSADAALGPYALVDCGGFVASLLLAAQSAGVAAIAQGATAGFSPVLHDHLGIPSEHVVVCTVALGRADEEHPVNRCRTGRAALDEFVSWRGFS